MQGTLNYLLLQGMIAFTMHLASDQEIPQTHFQSVFLFYFTDARE